MDDERKIEAPRRQPGRPTKSKAVNRTYTATGSRLQGPRTPAEFTDAVISEFAFWLQPGMCVGPLPKWLVRRFVDDLRCRLALERGAARTGR